MTPEQSRLVELYKEIADMTLPECRACRAPLSCCSPEYCEMAKEVAKDHWNVELVPTNHPRLPFMGPNGCTVAPHLRPLCSLHTCSVNSLGFKLKDKAWNKRYFGIREEIDNLELCYT